MGAASGAEFEEDRPDVRIHGAGRNAELDPDGLRASACGHQANDLYLTG
jgi:hypothetical protein